MNDIMVKAFNKLTSEIGRLQKEMNEMRKLIKEQNGNETPAQVAQPAEGRNLDYLVSNYLLNSQFPPNIKGYAYLKDAIIMAYENPQILNRITRGLYLMIADKYDTTPSRVERAMRHAIETYWSKQNKPGSKSFMSKPTNSEFIALSAEKIRLSNHNLSA